MAKKSFNEKLQDSKNMPEIIEVTDPKAIAKFGGTRMLIAPPLAYDAIIRTIPEGKVVGADLIRQYLAAKHDADYTCPLTAGIFTNIAAKASEERGFDEIPYWRAVKKDGELNEKYPHGIEGHQAKLEAEGHQIIFKGKRAFVANYEANLHPLS